MTTNDLPISGLPVPIRYEIAVIDRDLAVIEIEGLLECGFLVSSRSSFLEGRRKAIVDAYAPNTLRAVLSTWRRWSDFCIRTGAPKLPAVPESIVAFIEERNATCKRTTLNRDIAMLAFAHKIALLPNPCADPSIEVFLRAARRRPAMAPQSVPAIRKSAIDIALRKLKTSADCFPQHSYERLRCLRDGALLLVAYTALLRSSELVAVRLCDVQPAEDGKKGGNLLIGRSKTDQEGVGQSLYLPPIAMKWLDAWLDQSGVRSDRPDSPVFRSLPARDRSTRLMPPLMATEVARIFKRVTGCESVGSHSTRIGATEDLVRDNQQTSAIMNAGRWKSPAMVAHYSRNIENSEGAVAQMMANMTPMAEP